jgi:hypothetical protein
METPFSSSAKIRNEYEYTFTSFLPSGNPLPWYYDDIQKCAFAYGGTVDKWKRKPELNERIRIIKDSSNFEIVEVFINNEKVF